MACEQVSRTSVPLIQAFYINDRCGQAQLKPMHAAMLVSLQASPVSYSNDFSLYDLPLHEDITLKWNLFITVTLD